MASESLNDRRLVIVSNRLPFSASVRDGALQLKESAGGLVTGLTSFLSNLHEDQTLPGSYIWLGWPGDTIQPEFQEQLKSSVLSKHNSYPVFLSEEEMDEFYLGFCNKTIWPLFHYFPSYAAYDEAMWQRYIHVNKVFCDAIMEVVKEDDVVWVHDYHLMLLPRMLKDKMPNLQVGFFLHIPFPSFEIFRLMPGDWRKEILRGLLGSDLVGFHTYEYSQHFLQCVLRILGHEHNMGQVLTPEGVVKVETFPMGIDYDRFAESASSTLVRAQVDRLKDSLNGAQSILSVDRLDYSKGILSRLQAFELLLNRYPQYRGKVVMVMAVVPSRIGVEQYELMKRQIEELVGKINGKFGSIGWTPVVYQYRHIPFDSLVALYAGCDVGLVTPLRDGMNLVSKEYVASRTDGTGVLILSEMAGSVKELGEAIVINPNSREEMAEAMHQALETPTSEQLARNKSMQRRLARYTVTRWAVDFVDKLIETEEAQHKYRMKFLPRSEFESIVGQFKRSKRRLLLLDYDGTLVGLKRLPSQARPTTEVLSTLRSLAAEPSNTIVIISGRDRETLSDWFKDVPVNFVAEHGTWVRRASDAWKKIKEQSSEWKPSIRSILELYADRLPGAFVEEKDFSLVFHYRPADPEQGEMVARELADYLVSFTANANVQILRGQKVVEVRAAGVNKGTAATLFLQDSAFEFVMAIGDDWTDEDMFLILPPTAHSLKVGITTSHARYNVRGPSDVIELLEAFCSAADKVVC